MQRKISKQLEVFMKAFMDQDFLLSTEIAKELYHNFAETMPIIDYHCHIQPREIAQDRQFENITQIWLGEDHYKWRQMRSNGVEEYYITGEAPDREKFQKWVETLEMAIGNPLYHWSHLELQRYFGYTGVLNQNTAQDVWEICNARLKETSMSAKNLIKQSNVRLLCTTDDPMDDLKWHRIIKEDKSFDVQVLPTWRPDKILNIEKSDYLDYLEKLSEVADVEIHTFQDLKKAMTKRLKYFQSMGCCISDHGFDFMVYAPAKEEEIEKIFALRLLHKELSVENIRKFKTACMLFLAEKYEELDWVMQLHYGCKRDNNGKMYRKIGADTGFDCMSDIASGTQLVDFLNEVNERKNLPKTILYSLNPRDDALIGTIIGCFQNSDAVGKIQQGSAWWFNDHKGGMVRQMTSLANLGLLGNFIGMLTDSRSFLSYSRHEYFRRILCELIGSWVEKGEYPKDMRVLEKIVQGISYNNAMEYFGFHL